MRTYAMREHITNMLISLSLSKKIRVFQKYKMCLVIAFVASSVQEDILTVWGDV